MPMKERRPTIQSVAWVRDIHRANQLDLDPPYQRRSVWNRDFKQFFIDTILRNYPIPPIFLNTEILQDATQIYHVVDGKQRLLSILEFLEDVFPISTKNYSQPNLRGRYFSQLDASEQKKFYGYFLPFEYFTDVSDEEVTEIFDRFNRNVERLNAQELRHAKYGGAFISLMEQLADEPIWDELRFFGTVDRRRMRDVEFLSILFSFTMHGIEEGDNLDQYYADYDEEIPNVGIHKEKYNSVKNMVKKLENLILETRFGNRADFYSLWSALFEFVDNAEAVDYTKTAENLSKFASRVDQVPSLEDPHAAGEDALAYSQAVRAGTTKQPNRVTRKQMLLRCIARR